MKKFFIPDYIFDLDFSFFDLTKHKIENNIFRFKHYHDHHSILKIIHDKKIYLKFKPILIFN